MNTNDIIIDLSEHNGYVDFDKLKTTNVKGIIIRAGWIGNKNNHTVDKYFEDYYKNATRVGFPVGVYVYNYCKSIEAVKSGCKWLYNLTKGKTFDLGFFIDMEDNSTIICGKNNLTDIAKYFCEYFKNSGVYANLDWFKNYLNYEQLEKYTIWLAQYNSKMTFNKKVDLWQFSNKEKFIGIVGNVDTSKVLKNYPQEVENVVEYFINNSYITPVYCDWNCTYRIGSLNKAEKVQSLGLNINSKGERVVIVHYPVDKTSNAKVGFVRMTNGRLE